MDDRRKKGEFVGALGALLVHVAVIALLILVSFTVPQPDEDAGGVPVMLGNALAHGTDLRSTDRPWNGLVEHLDLAAIGTSNQVVDLLPIVGAAVCHSQQDSLNF